MPPERSFDIDTAEDLAFAEFLVEPGRASVGLLDCAIPRVFQQIWVGPNPVPEEHVRYQQSWLRHHPGWTFQLWTDENLPRDLERRRSTSSCASRSSARTC